MKTLQETEVKMEKKAKLNKNMSRKYMLQGLMFVFQALIKKLKIRLLSLPDL